MRKQVSYNQSELARLCGVSPQTISRHVDAGVIPRGEVQAGKRRLFTETQVQMIVRIFAERTKGEALGKYTYGTSPNTPGCISQAAAGPAQANPMYPHPTDSQGI